MVRDDQISIFALLDVWFLGCFFCIHTFGFSHGWSSSVSMRLLGEIPGKSTTMPVPGEQAFHLGGYLGFSLRRRSAHLPKIDASFP